MRKVGLVVGVDAYEQNSGIADLKYAGNDALALSRALRDVCGFDHVYALAGDREGSEGHGTRNAIFDRLDFAIHDLEADDLFLLAFFMHGTSQEVDGTRREFFLPHDARMGKLMTYIEQAMITEDLERLRARRRLLVLDCCRNDPQAGRGEAANALRTDQARDLSLAARASGGGPASTGVLTACSVGERAYESDRHKHGVFAYHLLQGITSAAWQNNLLEAQSVARYVAGAIRTDPTRRQTPTFQLEGTEQIVLARRQARPANDGAPRPSQVEVKAYPIDSLELEVDKVALREAPAGDPAVPPLSEDIRGVQGRVLGLNLTIAAIEQGVHPSLVAARRQVDEAEAQWRRLERDRDARWLRFSGNAEVPKTVFARFAADPMRVDLFRVDDAALAAIGDYNDRIEFLHSVRNAEQARLAQAAARESMAKACRDKVDALSKERDALARSLRTRLEAWFAALPNPARDAAPDAPFPVEAFIPVMRSLAEQLPSVPSETLWAIARTTREQETARRLLTRHQERARQAQRDREAVAAVAAKLVRQRRRTRVVVLVALVGGLGVFLAREPLSQAFESTGETCARLSEIGNPSGFDLEAAREACGRFIRDQPDNASAQFFAGRIAQREGNLLIAATFYTKSAEQGFAWAQVNLAGLYLDGQGVEQDRAKALALTRSAADQGNDYGQVQLGYIYANGLGVAEDDAEAVRWYRLSADQGNAQAQALLGNAYASGTGVSENAGEAFRWYSLAADQGNAAGQTGLAQMLEAGTPVRKDLKEAIRLYKLAAAQGNAIAQARLDALSAAD